MPDYVGVSVSEIWSYIPRKKTYITPSDDVIASADTERSTNSTSYVKMKEGRIMHSGKWRVKFDLRTTGSYAAFGQVYRNGSGYGSEHSTTSTTFVTFYDDLFFAEHDLCQLYIRIVNSSDNAVCANFRLCGKHDEYSDAEITLD